ncbi:23S rRNA (adenine(2503)-C(2))-methyltransferase RlmN [Fluviispira multicolorata]|uniref:Probable dual-specificity RNA methyltransferase RlmN n=1 Tax=Fluviispira multicolorata TaxID=2654512 RepID=A0A833N2X4_9BACT|nr:23S rRNA (adenine(2503)-C(2))-methyltransferase RlmN [Fluviispira multicolorata]KAB8033353.1 23S rRNA (adenine(2503)-C(2))-methyltransferase RlmN [Fluviispira multicolorata]
MNKKIALTMSEKDWADWFINNGDKGFRARQIMDWLFLRHCFLPQDFSNIPNKFREKLNDEFDWSVPTIDTILSSDDGSEKILLKLHDGRFSECVLMPSENRVTLCISSQVGCRMACTFCQTGKMGLSRNLAMGEILIQIVIANKRLIERNIHERKVTNIVFMGMGEPLDNYDNVVAACKLMVDPKMFGLSKHKVTVSTSGLLPEIVRLGQDVPVALAISLHSPDEEQRSSMMPINKKYSLAEMKKVLLEYPVQTRHGITFEYVMIKGVNDSMTHAKKLVKFLHGIKAKVNLIPMNPHPGADNMVATDFDRMREFQKYLSDRSIPAPVRYSRGQDVSAACGQLASKRKDELNLPPRTVALARRREYLNAKQDFID